MEHRDRYFAAAVCLSLALHVIALAVADRAGRNMRIWLPPLRRLESAVISLQEPEFHDVLGDRAGVGSGTNASDGLTPLQARQADEDQPLLSRDPQGPAVVAKASPPDKGPSGERGRGGQTGAPVAEAIPPATPPARPQPPQLASVQPAPRVDASPPADRAAEPSPQVLPMPAVPPLPDLTPVQFALSAPAEQHAAPPPAPPAPQPPATKSPPSPQHPDQSTTPVHKSPARVATGDGLAPGRAVALDPAQQSDSESDAFTKVGVAVYHNGKLSVRSGRKVKTVRPKLLVPGILDVIGVNDPTVILKISIDSTGKVTGADVIQSSGSNDIDQPCVVAVYYWWFEPAHDARGRPTNDTILFSISFR